MEILRLARRAIGLARFALRVRGIHDSKISIADAKRLISEGVHNRATRFLTKLEVAAYSNPKSPYLKLLMAAGYQLGDVENLVESQGLEGTLRSLADSGVYLTYDEFKCRTPTIRGSQTFRFSPSDFDDPNMFAESYGSSGGTGGDSVETKYASETVYQFTPHWALFLAENDCLRKPLSFWGPQSSGASSRQLACSRFNQPLGPCFVSEELTDFTERFYHGTKRLIAERVGDFPRPESAPYGQESIVLAKVGEVLARNGGMCLNVAPSAAVRISLAAQRRGINLEDLTFLLGGEPLTQARRRAIEASGAIARPLYGSSEASWIGGQCSHPEHPDEVHLLEDNYAVIPARPVESHNGGPVPLLMTSLQRVTSKILLNTDIGDLAILDSRSCSCLYGQVGCSRVLHTIRSSDKITDFGVNFAVADVCQVLEAALPCRVGGTAGDYQLVEERHSSGLPSYNLRISPRLPDVDCEEVVRVFFEELSKPRTYYAYMVNTWRRAAVFKCFVGEPLATRAGKMLPFYRPGFAFKPSLRPNRVASKWLKRW